MEIKNIHLNRGKKTLVGMSRIARLRLTIQDLEERGYIKRQEYFSLSTGEFERMLLRQFDK